MKVCFANHSRHIIAITVDDDSSVLLQPFENIALVRKDSDTIKILAGRNCESMKKSATYHLVIETEYIISNITDGMVFNIEREKIRFCIDAFYDRLFLKSSNALILSEKHKVRTEERMKAAFNKSNLIRMFLTGPLESLTELFVLMLIAGIVLAFFLGWKFFVGYFSISYLILIVFNFLLDKFCETIFKKVFKTKHKKKEFYDYFEEEFIRNYYADANRIPFIGSVEIN
jgi:ABC-type multidrug transport system fused ATPase/permease subunit